MDNDILTLKGESKPMGNVKEENFLRMERPFGPFSRSFSLPSTVDIDAIKASYKKGVLTVSLPKQEVTDKKKIKVTIA